MGQDKLHQVWSRLGTLHISSQVREGQRDLNDLCQGWDHDLVQLAENTLRFRDWKALSLSSQKTGIFSHFPGDKV